MKHDTETRNPIFPCACCVLVDAHLLCCYWLELPPPSLSLYPYPLSLHSCPPPLSIVYPPLHSSLHLHPPCLLSLSLPRSLLPLNSSPLYPPHPYIYALAFFLLPHTQPTPISRFVQGYIGAVTAAVGIAVSTIMLLAGGVCHSPPSFLAGRAQLSPAKGRQVFTRKEDDSSAVYSIPCCGWVVFPWRRHSPQSTTPTISCMSPPPPATASTLNSVLMRHHELQEGIEVVDENGIVIGTSTIAAKRVRGPVNLYRWRPIPTQGLMA